MKWFLAFSTCMVVGQLLAWGDGGAVPRVLQKTEPPDSGIVTLPGLPPRPAARILVFGASSIPRRPSAPLLPPPPVVVWKPSFSGPQRSLIEAFEAGPSLRVAPAVTVTAALTRVAHEDTAILLQDKIGKWTRLEADSTLGEPRHQRPALDDRGTPNGRIYAFADPSGRYRELELDFDAAKGVLREVFIYPWNMRWQECRRLWGANANATEANKGRTFYSYLNRRLDVLVSSSGQVISLGLY